MDKVARIIGSFVTHYDPSGEDSEVLHDAFPGDYAERTKHLYTLASQVLAALSSIPVGGLEVAAADAVAGVAGPISSLDADWFDEVEDPLDDYSDAEIIDGTTHPNKAMRLLCQLRETR